MTGSRPRGEKDIFFDTLTGLANRWRFEKRVQQLILKAEAREKPLALALIELRGLRHINGALGHTAGDAIVREVGETLKNLTPPEALLGRLDGDSFGALLTTLPSPGQALDWAAQVVEAIRRLSFTFEEHTVQVGANVGLSFCPEDSDNGPELLRQAYNALTAARAQGMNGVTRYRPEMLATAWDALAQSGCLQRPDEGA
jgi:diguanylate cyclase (GGDEF)-like protein